MSTKGSVGFFSFCLTLELSAKIKKRPGFYILTETRLSITQDLNKIKKNLTHPFADIGKTETCGKFQQNSYTLR